MDSLGALLTVILFCAWWSPKGTGQWLAEAHKSYRATLTRRDKK